MDRALLTYAHGKNGYREDFWRAGTDCRKPAGLIQRRNVQNVTLKKRNRFTGKEPTERIILDQVTHYQLVQDGQGADFFGKRTARLCNTQMHMQKHKRTMKLLSGSEKENGKIRFSCLQCSVCGTMYDSDAVETVECSENDAGIQVVMVTGDAEETAVADRQGSRNS